MDPATPAYCDAWELALPGPRQEPTVGLHDKEQWPGPPFTFDFVCVSADIAGCVRAVRVDESSDASDHPPMLLELA
jgi:endonuclease/exonuclease/phosphatase family metal-dependent hydrolase